jgi:serine/threonine protein kinase
MEFKDSIINTTETEDESIKSLSSTMSNEENIPHFETMKVSSPKSKTSINDFDILSVLGKGSYAKVVLGKNIYTGELFAIKIIDKKFLEKVKLVFKK